MNPLGRATPDSEAVASSEDERPWPSAPVFGMMPRKENGVPGLGGGIWSQKRGSFKMEKAAQRNAAREARLAVNAPGHSALRAGNTPSPAASEGSGALPFAIPLQPTPKAGRSLSHSQGQRDFSQGGGAHYGSNGDRDAGALPLGLLTEEDADTETESELGGVLTQTVSHPYALQRTSTLPAAAFGSYLGGQAYEDDDGDVAGGALSYGGGERGNGYGELSSRRSQWQSHLGWEDLPNVNESRRHSLAELPTRRGSMVGGAASSHARDGLLGSRFMQPPNSALYDWDGMQHADQLYRDNFLHDPTSTASTGGAPPVAGDAYTRADALTSSQLRHPDDPSLSLTIPENYRTPHIHIADFERSAAQRHHHITNNNMNNNNNNSSSNTMASMSGSGGYGGGGGPNRPRRLLYVVSFKCSRVDVFYLLENTGLQVREGDIVIVEADRGQDLGSVQHANITEDEARIYKKKYGEEQYRWLMMFSQNNQAGNVNPNAQAMYGENAAQRAALVGNAPGTMQAPQRESTLKPKAIKRLANSHEISMLRDKEGNEAKAKRACQQKVAHLGLDMEILDAEWQWDFQKLIFYYYAEHYINFKDLITELYRIYKTRIWMSAINPASFSQSAIGQPPSGIGPGAVASYGGQQQLNNSYTMMYGPDPDPYGAVPPYTIGYDTYTPNYPAIPGVANSFHPSQSGYGGNGMGQTSAGGRGDGMEGRYGQAPGGANYSGGSAMMGYGQNFGGGRFGNAQAPVGTRPAPENTFPGRSAASRGGAGGRGGGAEMQSLGLQFGQLGLGGGVRGGVSPGGSSSAGGIPLGRGDGAAGGGGRRQ